MSNSWSLWRLDRRCFTLNWTSWPGVGGEQCNLDRDKGGAVEKMGAEFEDKHGGRGRVKIFAFAPATLPPVSVHRHHQLSLDNGCTCPRSRSRSPSHRRVSAGEPPRETQFGVRALLEDRRTRHSWQSRVLRDPCPHILYYSRTLQWSFMLSCDCHQWRPQSITEQVNFCQHQHHGSWL